LKSSIRTRALALRRDQADKDTLSRRIAQRCRGLPQLDVATAKTVLIYAHVRDEVRTDHLMAELLLENRTVVVPWCEGEQLRLFQLEEVQQLLPGAFGVPEPRVELRDQTPPVDPAAVDAAILPGVAFDAAGGRIGYGRGFFDRLLAQLRPEAVKIALAYDCQIFDQVPCEHHDVRMNRVVTPTAVYGSR